MMHGNTKIKLRTQTLQLVVINQRQVFCACSEGAPTSAAACQQVCSSVLYYTWTRELTLRLCSQ